MITVDKATPMSSWKLPVTEVRPISNAFSTFFNLSEPVGAHGRALLFEQYFFCIQPVLYLGPILYEILL
jgi:hypothetical protein